MNTEQKNSEGREQIVSKLSGFPCLFLNLFKYTWKHRFPGGQESWVSKLRISGDVSLCLSWCHFGFGTVRMYIQFKVTSEIYFFLLICMEGGKGKKEGEKKRKEICGSGDEIIASDFCKKFLLKIRLSNSVSLGTPPFPA